MHGEFLAEVRWVLQIYFELRVRASGNFYLFFCRIAAAVVIAGETLLIYKTYINALKRQQRNVCVFFFFSEPSSKKTAADTDVKRKNEALT